jgi:secreted trypsin-like serine protease
VTQGLFRSGSGVCFGDSGGPRFDGQTLVAVTSSGDAACAGMSTSYRIDTPAARAFLDDFITLP